MELLVYSPLSVRFGGGFEHWLFEIAQRLKKFGVNTSVICTNSTVHGENEAFSKSISEVINSSFQSYTELTHVPLSFKNFNLTLPYGTEFKKFLKSLDNYDVLYFNNAYFLQDLMVCSMKLLYDIPVISGHHANIFQNNLLHDLYLKTIGKKCLNFFDAYHVLNSNDMSILKNWNANRITYIPIGVDVDKFKPKNFHKKDEFVVLFVGRLVHQKGISTLCETIDFVNRSMESSPCPELKFIIVGGGPLKSLVTELSKKHSNVSYLNYVSDNVLQNIYSESNLLIFPSQRETFGIVVLEAQASGLPVISSNIIGPKDIVVDGTTGNLVSINPSVFGKSILNYYALWKNKYRQYSQIRTAARDNVTERFSWAVVTQNFYDFLKSVYES